MKAAFATWNNRIAPQFDAARQACIVEARGGAIADERLETFRSQLPIAKVSRLVELGVGTLVCGAISRPIQALLAAQGIRVVPFVSGDLRAVIRAWINGGEEYAAFAMPGHGTRSGQPLEEK
jgi:predicted Fe-Mo cluster-binding NifX family protein